MVENAEFAGESGPISTFPQFRRDPPPGKSLKKDAISAIEDNPSGQEPNDDCGNQADPNADPGDHGPQEILRQNGFQ
jgi:hypothetical protein